MGGRKRNTAPPELARARDRFDSWRRTSRPKARIPESLWKLAAEVAAKHGLSRTASTLRLGYYALKKRVEKAETERESQSPAFLELPSVAGAAQECVIEMFDGADCRMRMQLKGYGAAEVASVGRCLQGDG